MGFSISQANGGTNANHRGENEAQTAERGAGARERGGEAESGADSPAQARVLSAVVL